MKKIAGVKCYETAKEIYASYGVDVDKALDKLGKLSISLHCWQGDDVGGFEGSGSLDGGLQATGNYPGKARTAEQLRSDFEKALSLIPGKHRVNLHAIYAETGGKKVERNKLLPEHFSNWAAWAKANGLGLDFNPTCFSHPNASDGFTLSHKDKAIRDFWIEHCVACREIGASFGRKLGKACVTNVWIPDGCKDIPADRRAPRERLEDSLDKVFKKKIDPKLNLDAVEPKLFGIGSESYVVGSHEFYMGYAVKNRKLLTLDTGHFHPTESVADKISAVMLFMDEILLHVSRGIRWDSDHVVILSDELKSLSEELVRGDYLSRVHIGLDYFDASINRVAAWVIGSRNTLKSLLIAMLEPSGLLKKLESSGDLTGRLAIMEEAKTLPFPAVWRRFCEIHCVPAGTEWLDEVRKYEKDVLLKR